MASNADPVTGARAASLGPQKKKYAKRSGRGNATTGRGGVITPENSLGPDEQRNEADKARREAEGKGKEREGAEFSTTKEPLPEDEEDVENESSTGGDPNIQEVLKCGLGEPRNILGVEESDDNSQQEEAILDAFWNRGYAVHPKANSHKDAEKALNMVLEAGKTLGVGDQAIEELQAWDGKHDEVEGDGMDGVVEQVPWPTQVVQAIYQKATPQLAKLQQDPKSKSAAKELDILNDQIKKGNEKDEIDPDQWIIRYQEFADIYQKARPAIDRIQKDPNDKSAKDELDKHSHSLAFLISHNHYLPWNIDLDIATAGSPKKPATGQTKSSGLPKPTPTIPASQTAQEAPATSQAAQKIQSETLKVWASMGWATHKMSDGDIILSHKALSKEGKEPYAFEFTVMTQDDPYFQVKLGSEIGRQEMDAYLAMPKIYKISTDRGDKDTPVYTYRNKVEYSRLLWTATKPRKLTEAGKKPRTGDTQCCVVWKDGTVAVMARGHFKTVTTENEAKAIETYCKSVDIKAPWEMNPKTLTVSANSALGQQLLQAGRTGSAINLNTAAPDLNTAAPNMATSNADNPGTVPFGLQNTLKGIETTMTMMQEQIKRQQDNQTELQKMMMEQQTRISEQQKILLNQQAEVMTMNQRLIELMNRLSSPPSQGSTSS